MSTAEFIPPKPVQRWQADDYASKGRFVSELARPVVDLLAPKRGERILDLGCSDGVLTEVIAASGADVLGADLSEELLPAAAAKGLKVQRADGHALPFKGEFGAVFTNAALHWMRRPKLVIAGVHRALKPRGRFVGEFGGHGNVAAIATAIRAVSALHQGDPAKVAPWFFPSVAEYRRLLEQGGLYRQVHRACAAPDSPRNRHARMARDVRPFFLRPICRAGALRGLLRGLGSVASGSLRRGWRVDGRPHQTALRRGADSVRRRASASPHPCQIHGGRHAWRRVRRSGGLDAGSKGAGHDATV
jgi:SAM-dependent methyltransferase